MEQRDQEHMRLMIQEAVKAGTEQAVKQTLQLFGVDVNDPLGMQKDFAMMRRLREGSAKAQLAAIGGAITLLLGLIGILIVNGAGTAIKTLLSTVGGDSK